MPLEFALIFMGGLLGSSHCVGMCGGFVVALSAGSSSFRANIFRQLIFTAGRVLTYSTMGGLAGAGGVWITHRVPLLEGTQAGLGIVAGVALIVQGLFSLGLFRRTHKQGSCLMAGPFRGLLASPRRRGAFAAGVLTAFIPCGLVYAFLALAASAHSLSLGMLTMLVFGAGTAPLMIAVGSGVSLVSLRFRERMLRVATICVIATGVLAITRGVHAWSSTATPPESAEAAHGCPLCSTDE